MEKHHPRVKTARRLDILEEHDGMEKGMATHFHPFVA